MKEVAAGSKRSRLHGTFQLPDNQEAFGELRLKGRKTLLKLGSRADLPLLENIPYLHGTTLDHRRATCIDCVGSTRGSEWKDPDATYHFAHVFPHYVTVGDAHLDPHAAVVRSVHFSVDDLPSLFYDFGAFRLATDRSVIDAVLGGDSVAAGGSPLVAYFTGKLSVIEVDTAIGKLAVSHRPSHNFGGPQGISIKNWMGLSIEPAAPITFHEAMDRMMTAVRFLSAIAGRRQGVHNIQLRIKPNDTSESSMSVHWSYGPTSAGANAAMHKPHPGDVPLDPIHRPEEFSRVLKDWMAREEGWRVPRVRFLNCLHKGNSYNADRLVAAANMFDLLPPDAVPLPTTLDPDLDDARRTCLELLRKHPPSQDRNSAISALSRMGKPSLPKKVLHRAALVENCLGPRLTGLSYVVKLAVQCRNYFVHGGSDDFDFIAVEPLMAFLTDALEFVFAASDLLDAGWDAAEWNREPHGTGHSFARFCASYPLSYAELKRVTETRST